MMKKICVSMLAAAALCGSVLAQSGSPVAKNGALSVQGNRIVNKDGNPVALRGMSFFWNTPSWGQAGYYTSGVVNTLADDWKADIVRVAVDPYSTSEDNWKNVVTAAKAKGIYVIIDFHAHSKDLSDNAKTFFDGLSKDAAYKNVPNIIYEIFNEPCPSSNTSQNGGGGCKGDSWTSDIKPYAEKVVKAIRDNGDTNVVIIGTPDFSKRVDEAAASPVSGKNLAYAVHYYTAEPGTQHQSSLRAWASSALNKGLALFVTEFGISEADGGQNNPNKIDTDEANRWFEFLDRNNIGWANWSISNKSEAASALKGSAGSNGNWGAGDLSPSGTFIRQKLIDYGTRNVTVTATIANNQGGTVEISPPGGTYRYGTPVTITPKPAEGWDFDGWSGSVTGRNNPYSFGPLYENKSVTATFTKTSMIKNGMFSENTSQWSSASATLARDPGGFLVVTVNGSASPGRVQQTGIKSLVPRTKYELSFRAKTASGTRKITPWVTNSSRNRVYNKDTSAIDISSAWLEKKIEFTMCYETAGALVTDSNATLAFQFNGGGSEWMWHLDDVALNPVGQGTCPGTAALPTAVTARRASWSLVGAGGALQLRGPAEAGARVSIYDVRGKMVRSAVAKDGMTLGAGVPAGSYFVVVKNRAGSDVFRTKMVMAR